MKKLLLFLTALLLSAIPVLAEETPEPGLTIAMESPFTEAPEVHVTDESFIGWLEPLLAAEAPCMTPVELRPGNHRFLLTFTEADGTQTQYGLWHDTLYEQAIVTHPEGDMHHISPDVPALLYNLMYDNARFSIPEAHRALLAAHGWTVAYRLPSKLLLLPETLEASRTDTAALHFTWADLFLRDAGYDITERLGKSVELHQYRVYERVDRIAWSPEDAVLHEADGSGGVMISMTAVVLEHDGQIVGAYMQAISWDGADLMSLNRHSPIDLLDGRTIEEYLLSKLPVTAEETALAALTPEEVIRQYAEVNDPRLMNIRMVLRALGTAGGGLYEHQYALPTGQTALSVTPMENLPGFWNVRGEGWSWYPEVALESPETGWKILHFYNSGI